jgi:hypothetical protein
MPTKMTKDQFTALSHKKHLAKCSKVAQQGSKTRDIPWHTFSLWLALTKEQKLYFQHAFGIISLVKQLACTVPMTTKCMQELYTWICTKELKAWVYAEPVPKGKRRPRKGYKEVSQPNKFLPPKFHEHLCETKLGQHNKKARVFLQEQLQEGQEAS